MLILKKFFISIIVLGVILGYCCVSNEPGNVVVAGTPAPTVNPSKATSVITPQYPTGATEFRISPQGIITVKLSDATGSVLAGRTINWPSDSNPRLSSLSTLTDVNGISSVTGIVPVHAGVYRTSFSVSFPGDSTYNSSTCLVKVYVYAPGTPTPRPTPTPIRINITGTVYDNNTGQPIPGAWVTNLTAGNGTQAKADGTYNLYHNYYGTRPTSLNIRVEAMGYLTQNVTLTVPASGNIIKDYYLVPGTVTPSPIVTPTPNPVVTPTPTAIVPSPTQIPGTPTPSPTPVLTPTPVPPIGSFKIQFYNQSTAATSNQLYPNIKLLNTGTSAISLANVKIRYYYTVDGAKTQTFYCDYSSVGSANVTGTFVTMATPKTGADNYLEIGFLSGAGSLAAGGNTTIQARIAKNDWSNYNQSNDYSFNSNGTTYMDWIKVTGYLSGVLQWGIEP